MFAVLTIYFSASQTLFGSEFLAAQMTTSFFSWDDNLKGIMTGIGSLPPGKAMPTMKIYLPMLMMGPAWAY